LDKSIKQQVKALLTKKDYGEIVRLCHTDKRFWRSLRLFLYETDETLRWDAIETIASLMGKWWHEGKKEAVLEYIRNLLWLLNDESGGIGWGAPETIAETIILIPELLQPYGSMMMAHALEGPPMLNSGLWAIGRLGKRARESIPLFQDRVFAAFDSREPQTLGLAAWAMGQAGFTPALAAVKTLADRKELVRILIDGHFQEKPLGDWAQEAIASLSHEES
jgi:hypothetical protein